MMPLFAILLASIQDIVIYPETRKGDVVEVLHGTRVPDPYRWLEDADSAETKAWVQAQNQVTFKFLERIPERDRIKARLTELWNYERFGIPTKQGGKYFYTRNDGLQNQAVLYVADSLRAEPRVLLDPNKLSRDGTVALSTTDFSPDGKYLAYSIAKGGSDWQEFHIREVSTGKDLSDQVDWAKFTGAEWSRDGKGFYYGRYAKPEEGRELQGTNYFQKLYYHRTGTPQNQDVLVYERPDQKEWGFSPTATEDGRYLVLSVWKGSERKNNVFYKDLKDPSGKVVEMLTGFTAEYTFLGNDGPVFYFLTDREAPKKRIIAIDTRSPAEKNWRTIVPEAHMSIEAASLLQDRFFVQYLKDASTQVLLYDLKGNVAKQIEMPGLGTAAGFDGERKQTETFYSYASFTTPGRIYRYDIKAGESELFKKPELKFNPDDYEVRQGFFPSTHNSRIPMFIVHKKGLEKNGQNPTLIYGYGGFNQSETPFFSPSALNWVDMGGVFVVVNARGGGEYGKEWHDAGRLKNKQNTFDDFIAAAQGLIDESYTSPSKLAITGGSNGGLMVGAVINQRPDLFAAALPVVGVMDMLRFHKFTIGWAWTSDYGSPDDPEQFKTLYAYSPLHNIKPQNYPAVLITTGDHDDRVVPAHSFKYAAALQAAQQAKTPVLIRIETSAGHGAGKPTDKIIQETADKYAFLVKALGMKLD